MWPAIAAAAGMLGGNIYSAEQQRRSATKANESNERLAMENRMFSHDEATRSMDFSAAQAQSQMDFQERMSNTGYQRATADMKAAGINPMFAMDRGGASTPSGASASGSMGSGTAAHILPVPPTLTTAMSGAKDLANTYATLRSAYANWKNTDASTLNIAMDTNKKAAEIGKLGSSTGLDMSRLKNLDMHNTRLIRQVDWESKNPGFNLLLDQLQRRLPIINSAGALIGKTKSIMNMGGSGIEEPGIPWSAYGVE